MFTKLRDWWRGYTDEDWVTANYKWGVITSRGPSVYLTDSELKALGIKKYFLIGYRTKVHCKEYEPRNVIPE